MSVGWWPRVISVISLRVATPTINSHPLHHKLVAAQSYCTAVVVLEQPILQSIWENSCKEKPNTQSRKVIEHHWRLSVLSEPKTYYTWRLWSSRRLGVVFWASKSSLWIASDQVCEGFGSLPWRLTWVIGRGLSDLSSRTISWRLGLLSSISASPTRRTVVTATGTGRTNPESSSSKLVISLHSFTSVLCCEDCLLCCPKTLSEDFPYHVFFCLQPSCT